MRAPLSARTVVDRCQSRILNKDQTGARVLLGQGGEVSGEINLAVEALHTPLFS